MYLPTYLFALATFFFFPYRAFHTPANPPISKIPKFRFPICLILLVRASVSSISFLKLPSKFSLVGPRPTYTRAQFGIDSLDIIGRSSYALGNPTLQYLHTYVPEAYQKLHTYLPGLSWDIIR
ncbi:hypothetical protein F4813DRAFT_347522 [Daldinia decipiens]|uniref:uncharacterized protein n=1 Tax=Daldinia decipiens TaxID=326647 RepID=UPI0020C35D2A|nr:uncharacterized protein F4813DRAFT_347522 [Daldinia decipiens]KAI1661434.1 hypothetical protein F4813DRAFT_347522 [Daldinia decipiens]